MDYELMISRKEEDKKIKTRFIVPSSEDADETHI